MNPSNEEARLSIGNGTQLWVEESFTVEPGSWRFGLEQRAKSNHLVLKGTQLVATGPCYWNGGRYRVDAMWGIHKLHRIPLHKISLSYIAPDPVPEQSSSQVVDYVDDED